jgi:hypothetical protein
MFTINTSEKERIKTSACSSRNERGYALHKAMVLDLSIIINVSLNLFELCHACRFSQNHLYAFIKCTISFILENNKLNELSLGFNLFKLTLNNFFE